MQNSSQSFKIHLKQFLLEAVYYYKLLYTYCLPVVYFVCLLITVFVF